MEETTIVFFLGLFYLCCSSVKEVHSQKTETNGTCKGQEACLYADIFSGYNRLTRPLKNYNKTIKVKMEFVFNALLDIEEKDEIMRVVGFFRAFWYDELLKWNPEDYGGVKAITVPAQTIWLPDIGITNSVSRFYEVTYKRDFHLQIRHDGKIRWTFGGILATSCDIDLTYYPFDHQRCGIEIESWQYVKDKISLELHSGNPVNLDDAGDDPQWVLVNATGESYLKYGKRFSALKFTLHWMRKPLYFYVNIIVPGAYMALITLGVFWLPIECGEKMSLGITVVLAFSVFQIVIMDITPVSSDAVPQITEMVLIVMTLATVSLLSSMFVSYLSDYDTPPPRWVKKVFLYYIPRITRMSSYELYKDEMTGNTAKDLEHKGQTADASDQHLLEEHNGKLKQGLSDKKSEKESKSAGNGEEMKANEATGISGKKQNQYVALDKEERAHIKENVKEILALLKDMKVRFADDEDGKRIKEYWKYVGMAFDRLIFWLCFIVFICYLLYAFITVQVSQHRSQDQLIE